MGTLRCALENGADLYVNERQKIRHYRARSAEERRRERRRMLNRIFTSRGVYENFRYIALIRLGISHKTRWGCLKCVIVYIARYIPAFVMYCVYGEFRSSLLIESTDSMITTHIYIADMCTKEINKCTITSERSVFS